jgi:hypothetical protein
VHSGDPRTLKALFFGELWRGRDNLRVTLRVPITLRSIPSLALPLVTLSAVANMAVGLVSWPIGGWRIALAACAMMAALSAARAAMMLIHARAHRPNATLALQAWLVSSVYDVARGLALVARGGHNLRRKA